MKISRVFLRWYKSFNINYRGYAEKAGVSLPRPWNSLGSTSLSDETFPFIEIPIEPDVTTIVGANESGKSHLLSAISKVLTGNGISPNEVFGASDLCRFAAHRSANLQAWPHIGVELYASDTGDLQNVLKAAAAPNLTAASDVQTRLVLMLAPKAESSDAFLFIGSNDTPHPLSQEALEKVRGALPSLQFLDAKAVISDHLPIDRLLLAYGSKIVKPLPRYELPVAQRAAYILSRARVDDKGAIAGITADEVAQLQSALRQARMDKEDQGTLEVQLFRDVLGIQVDTLEYIYQLPISKRGHIEYYIQKWNDDIEEKLNLSHYWQQDDQFALRLVYKDGVIYFEITDKTGAIYTFGERSSGLKYFLSYYIQAKALELSGRHRNSIILMDEPDSYLSILGQRNLLSVFESLVRPESSGGTSQLVYTTHSPFLINQNFPRRIRVVKKEEAEEGTQYIESSRVRRYEPVRSALGVSSAQSLFMGAVNILLEGPTDQYLLSELIREFSSPDTVREYLDLNGVVLVSADGVTNVERVLAASQWGDEPIPTTIVLLDSDAAGITARDRITGKSQGAKKLVEADAVLHLSDLVNAYCGYGSVVTIEDVVPRRIYMSAVKQYVCRWMKPVYDAKAADLEAAINDDKASTGPLVEAVNELFQGITGNKEFVFDKMGIMQEVVRIVSESRQSPGCLQNDIRLLESNVQAICHGLNEAIDASKRKALFRSATQSIKRIIHDFERIHSEGSSLADLERLIHRLDREANELADDGQKLAQALTKAKVDIISLKKAGQRQIAGKSWRQWSQQIDGIKRNPLTAEWMLSNTAPQAAAHGDGSVAVSEHVEVDPGDSNVAMTG